MNCRGQGIGRDRIPFLFQRSQYAEVKLAAKFLRTILLNIKGFEISLEESEKHLSKLRLQYF